MRPFPTNGLELINRSRYRRSRRGPDHPHLGFETVTYILEAEFDHEDSVSHRN